MSRAEEHVAFRRGGGARLRRAGVEVLFAAGGHVTVVGECMTPAVPRGASARAEPCVPADLLPGDVVLLQRGGVFVLHRFLKALRVRARRRLLVKADRAERPDAPWPLGSLVGRLAEIREGDTVRPYRPGFRERVRAAAEGLFWSNVRPFLKSVRDFMRIGPCRRRS